MDMPLLPLANIWSPTMLLIVLAIVIIFFGGAKIPELMRGMGKGMGEFKKGVREGREDDEDDDLDKRRKALEAKKKQLEEEEAELQRMKSKSD